MYLRGFSVPFMFFGFVKKTKKHFNYNVDVWISVKYFAFAQGKSAICTIIIITICDRTIKFSFEH